MGTAARAGRGSSFEERTCRGALRRATSAGSNDDESVEVEEEEADAVCAWRLPRV